MVKQPDDSWAPSETFLPPESYAHPPEGLGAGALVGYSPLYNAVFTIGYWEDDDVLTILDGDTGQALFQMPIDADVYNYGYGAIDIDDANGVAYFGGRSASDGKSPLLGKITFSTTPFPTDTPTSTPTQETQTSTPTFTSTSTPTFTPSSTPTPSWSSENDLFLFSTIWQRTEDETPYINETAYYLFDSETDGVIDEQDLQNLLNNWDTGMPRSPVGGWDLFYYWPENGFYVQTDWTLYGDGTFTSDGQGYMGVWEQDGFNVTIAYQPGIAVYTGAFNSPHNMSGTMTAGNSSGLWYADRSSSSSPALGLPVASKTELLLNAAGAAR